MAHSQSVWVSLWIVIAITVLFVLPGPGIANEWTSLQAPYVSRHSPGVLDTWETARGVERTVAVGMPPSGTLAAGAGYVGWTLCLDNGTLETGDRACASTPSLSPSAVAYDTANKDLYVANLATYTVSVIDSTTDRFVTNISLGWFSNPRDIVYDNANGNLYVPLSGGDEVSVISGTSNIVTGTITVGTSPYGIALDSANGDLYVANSGSSNVSVISGSTNAVVASLSVGSGPLMPAYDSSNQNIYVVENSAGYGNLTVINGRNNKVSTTILMGQNYPDGLAFDGANGYLYVSDMGITVINGATNAFVTNLTPAVTWGGYQTGGVYNPANGLIYLPSGNGGNILVYDASDTLVGNLVLSGGRPGGAYDSANGDLYMAGDGDDSLSIIVQGTVPAISFVESGLPAGTYWTVTLAGVPNELSTGNINFTEPNGTYGFAVTSTIPSYHASPSSGVVSVSGKNLTIPVFFTETEYNVTFQETGLPSNAKWGVQLLGSFNNSTNPSIGFREPNGTYNFVVGNVSRYTAAPPSGLLTLNGGNVTQHISFSKSYTVSFIESGLPSGASWWVMLNGTKDSSTTSIIAFPNVLNNTAGYPFTVGGVSGYTANPSTGMVPVNGTNVTKLITFTKNSTTKPTYTVTLTESGLPVGTSWSVALNGTTNTSTGTTITFTEINGTYTYTVGNVTSYTPNPSAGSVTVKGGSAGASISFTVVPTGSYSVTFTETGLPTSANWSVTLSGKSISSTGSTLSFTEKNGTYNYTVTAPMGYAASPASGSLAVSGKAVSQSITFTRSTTSKTTYAVTFTESGLASGTNWSVTLNGITKSSTTTTITFQEVNGSYDYSVGAVTGYMISPSSGTIKVSGQAASQTITFTSSSTSKGKINQTTGFLGLPGYDGYILIGAVVAVAAIVTTVLLLRGRGKPTTPPSKGGGKGGHQDGIDDSKNIADGASREQAVE